MIEVQTFGCRVNLAEAEMIRHKAAEAGLAAAFIVNSCAVTDEAVRQARQAVRRGFRENPERPIFVTGCAAQIDQAGFAEMAEVAGVIGNREKLTADAFKGGARVRVGDIFAANSFALPALSAIDGKTRGFVQVQTGCDHRCTFCIIPFGRGASRSLAPDDVIAAVRRFVEEGAKEVVLTGIDLVSYGHDLGDHLPLGRLIRRILREFPDLPRLRLSSLDCIEIDGELIAAYAEEERLMPSLHLSLQAGDNLILKRMKRRHAREDAIALISRLKKLRPELIFTADLIAGFPTEEEPHFQRSLDLIGECDLARVHVFAFSPRPGTPAARMPQVPAAMIKERARRLRSASAEAYQRCLQARVGTRQSVLGERGAIARTAGGLPVKCEVPPGVMARVEISGVAGERLVGAEA